MQEESRRDGRNQHEALILGNFQSSLGTLRSSCTDPRTVVLGYTQPSLRDCVRVLTQTL